jgi:hypothetical protein
MPRLPAEDAYYDFRQKSDRNRSTWRRTLAATATTCMGYAKCGQGVNVVRVASDSKPSMAWRQRSDRILACGRLRYARRGAALARGASERLTLDHHAAHGTQQVSSNIADVEEGANETGMANPKYSQIQHPPGSLVKTKM